jgi:hypothetical protein
MKAVIYSSKSRRLCSAFSLFEVMFCVAFIGIMAGLAVPMLSQSNSIYAARDRRNAQELCSTCMLAQAAQLDFVQDDSVLDTVRSIVRGGISASGLMKGRVFVVPGLSDEDMEGAAKYLRVQDGQLMYTITETAFNAGDQRL